MLLAYQIAEESGIKVWMARPKCFKPFMACSTILERVFNSSPCIRLKHYRMHERSLSISKQSKTSLLSWQLFMLTQISSINVDESSVNMTQHKGNVIIEVKIRGVHWVVAVEEGKNHMILACSSASQYSLPLMIIFP